MDDYFKVFEDGEYKYYRLDEDFVPGDQQSPSRSMADETITIIETPIVEEETIIISSGGGSDGGANGANGANGGQ